WTDLQLTSDTGAGQKIEDTLLSFENGERVTYNTYWKWRQQIEAGSGVLTAQEEALYLAHYTTLYGDAAQAQAAVEALRQSRQQQYDQLDQNVHGELLYAYGDMEF